MCYRKVKDRIQQRNKIASYKDTGMTGLYYHVGNLTEQDEGMWKCMNSDKLELTYSKHEEISPDYLKSLINLYYTLFHDTGSFINISIKFYCNNKKKVVV